MKNKRILSSFLFALFLIGGPVLAQSDDLTKPGILPGSGLYFFDMLFERIGLAFTFGDVPKANKLLSIAEERLSEAVTLAQQNQADLAQKAAGAYGDDLAEAEQKASDAQQNGTNVDNLLQKIAQATLKHQSVLAGVLEKVPDQAKPAITSAMSKSSQGYNKAIEAVSKDKQNAVHDQLQNQLQDLQPKFDSLRTKGISVPVLEGMQKAINAKNSRS